MASKANSCMIVGVEAGYCLTQDYEGYRQERMSKMNVTVKNGIRWRTAKTYPKLAPEMSNLDRELLKDPRSHLAWADVLFRTRLLQPDCFHRPPKMT